MEAYSKEFRRDVLAACDAGEGTRLVALRFDVSESWVRRIKQERREQGKLAPLSTRRRRKIWEPHTEWLLAKLDQRPDIYLRELQAAAQAELGWEVSDVTLSRACRALRRTRKKDASSERATARRRCRSAAAVGRRPAETRPRSSRVRG
jgi:transposase